MLYSARSKFMSKSKHTSKLALKKRLGSRSARQGIKWMAPQEIFRQLIGKADHLPANLSKDKIRALTE